MTASRGFFWDGEPQDRNHQWVVSSQIGFDGPPGVCIPAGAIDGLTDEQIGNRVRQAIEDELPAAELLEDINWLESFSPKPDPESWWQMYAEAREKAARYPELLALLDRVKAKAVNPPVQPRNQPPKRSTEGWVYLLQAPNGLYKIGRSKDVESRIKTFGVKLPFEVALLHSFQCTDYISAEQELHGRYAAKRVGSSEFFALTSEDVQAIKAIKEM